EMVPILQQAPMIKMLVTSTIKLDQDVGVEGGTNHPLQPLAVPPDGQQTSFEAIEQSASVRLFVHYAHAANNFKLTPQNAPLVAEICRRLEGLPLSIKLVAPQVASATLRGILESLKQVLSVSSGQNQANPPWHSSLRATISWSYNRLTREEKKLFRRLGVFRSGRTSESAQKVCSIGGDLQGNMRFLINGLIRKSMLSIEDQEVKDTRYIMLEALHEYAREQLSGNSETEIIQRQHATYFLQLAKEADSPGSRADQGNWLQRLELEHDNFRGALAWAVRTDAKIALGLCCELTWFWKIKGYSSEGRRWLDDALNASNEPADEMLPLYAQALNKAGYLALIEGDYSVAEKRIGQSRKIFTKLKDKRGIAAVLRNLGRMALYQAEYEKATRYYKSSLAYYRASKDIAGMATVLRRLGRIRIQQGKYKKAAPALDESLKLYMRLKDRRGRAAVLRDSALVAMYYGNFAEARKQLEESKQISIELSDKLGIAVAITNLGEVARCEKAFPRAAELYEESCQLFRELGARLDIAITICDWAYALVQQGNYEQAESYFRDSMARSQALAARHGIANCLAGWAGMLVAKGDIERAVPLFSVAGELLKTICATFETADQLDYDQSMKTAREQLPQERWDNLWAEGQRMPVEEAINLVLRQ
ncbi:MAG TPA: tetratricopeptide repeat protein, partial [Chloroflexia bacterium]|nr:tetratricopeptide repeat protein [Chloroflexia bacterium]